MEEYSVTILEIEEITKGVKKFRVEKPKDYGFSSGHHTIVAINKPTLKDKKKPFSFSSTDGSPFLEFIVKIYAERDGVTKAFDKLDVGDELIIGKPWGKINYFGKGTFIAAGSGITPFVSIFRQLKKEGNLEGNNLIFSNKVSNEIILEDELKRLLGKNVIFTLTRENKKGYENGRIDEKFIKENVKDFEQNFYICGPFQFVSELKKTLMKLGAKEENIGSEI